MTSDDITHGAAQLAERILDEVSRPDQNWGEVALLARELASLADVAAPAGGSPIGDESPTEEP